MASKSPAQTRSGVAILLLLAGIAAGILYKQAHYDPLSWGRPTPPRGAAAVAAGGPLDLAGFKLEGPTPLGPPEQFDPQILSDKIDGKAELYFSAGFKALVTRRYHLPDNAQAWFEVFVFDQGQDQGAYSVFSVQRRNQGQKLDLAAEAYLSGASLFILRGAFYVEVIAAGDSPQLQAGMRTWAQAWLKSAPAPAQQSGPPEGLDQASLSLLAANVFGCDKLDQVYAGTYQVNGQEATGFLSRWAEAGQAAELTAAYAAFLLGAGGQEEQASGLPPGARLIRIMDTYDLVWSQGAFLAGAHGAESLEAALDLGKRLHQRLSEAKP